MSPLNTSHKTKSGPQSTGGEKNAPKLLLIAVGTNQLLAFSWSILSSLPRPLSVKPSLFKPVWTHLAPTLQRSVIPVHLSGVLLGVDGHGSNPQLSASSEHTDSDLTWRKLNDVEEMGKWMVEKVVIFLIICYAVCVLFCDIFLI